VGSVATDFQAALADLPVAVVRRLEHYPSETELLHLLRSVAPQVIFLSVEHLGQASAVALAAGRHAPGVQVLALGAESNSELLLEIMRAGVREFLSAPFDQRAIREALLRVDQVCGAAPQDSGLTDLVFSFLPAKAGVGASTVALNASAALSRLKDTRVLLADFDLNSGMLAFMLKLECQYGVIDAAENAFTLDENLWRQLVTARGSLDLLEAGKIRPGFRIEPASIRSILDFVRRRYKAVCLDLSGNLEKYSIEIMHESNTVFLVCTTELPSLHLAREKLAFLRSLELDSRVSIVLNRVGKRDVMSTTDVEKLLGLPVRAVLPNDYAGIHRALASGQPVDPSTDLGGRFTAFAETVLLGKTGEASRSRRFVDYFSLLPAHHSLSPARKATPN
jgi:pilus assembly protein CpaE